MTILPEEAVKAAMDAFHEAWNNNQGRDNELPAYAHRTALTAALPFLQGVKVKALEWVTHKGDQHCKIAWTCEGIGGWYAIEHRHEGHFDMWTPNNPDGGRFITLEAAKAAAQADYERRIIAALEPAATCKESLQVEPAAPEGQQPVADALELSGNTGELIDRMAAAIRDWGSHYDDGPWETLSEDRKAGWRGDAERALAVVKEYLTARRPSEQAVTEAMVEAVQRIRNTAMRQSIVARIPECGEFGGIAQDADWLLDTLKAAREAGR
ncbi:hypothetical protein LWV33_21760 [Brucella intermedia]